MPRKPLKNPKRNQIRIHLAEDKMLKVRVIAILSDQTVSAWLSDLIDKGIAREKGARKDRRKRNMGRPKDTVFANAYVTDETADSVKAICKRIDYSKQSWLEEIVDREIAAQAKADPDLFNSEERMQSIVHAYKTGE